MCGIAGFVGSFEPPLLQAMCGVLAHRGPDNQAIYTDASGLAGLAHTRLSIIDLSPRSNQPLRDISGRFWIVFNGEVYNYKSLRSELLAGGCDFRTDGDGEVILNGFIRHGVDFLARLNGIYAFAIWDALRREIFIARDPFGVKPLYYAETERGLVFASEIKALLHAADVSRDLDYMSLWQAVTFLWTPTPRTALKSVRKLEPGHYLRASQSGMIECAAFSNYPPFDPANQIALPEAKSEVLRLLKQAVKRQLVSDAPVGAFLSGGVDSSAICHFAAEAIEGSLECFTIEIEGGEAEGMAEDLVYAAQMASTLRAPLDVVRVTPDVVADLPRMIFALDEPQADLAPINAMYIAQRARDKGIKVLLSGAGGDDIFSGYRRHVALQHEFLWAWMPRFAREVVASTSELMPQRPEVCRRLSKAFAYAGLPPDDRLLSYFYWMNPQSSLALFSPEVREQIAISDVDVGAPMRRSMADGVAGAVPLNKMLYLEQKYFLLDHNLNYTDKVSMLSGVEVRVPFLDPDLVAFANRIPVEWKCKGGEAKWILKSALHGLLPDSLLHRRKTGFGVPLRAWLRGPLRPFVDEMLSAASIKRRGLFDYAATQRLLAADRAGKVDAAYSILSLICIEVWARQFVDPVVPTSTL